MLPLSDASAKAKKGDPFFDARPAACWCRQDQDMLLLRVDDWRRGPGFWTTASGNPSQDPLQLVETHTSERSIADGIADLAESRTMVARSSSDYESGRQSNAVASWTGEWRWNSWWRGTREQGAHVAATTMATIESRLGGAV
jgi:hypothetical protein